MNYRLVISRLGLLLTVLSAIMVVTSGLFYAIELPQGYQIDRDAAWALFVSGAAGAVLGMLVWAPTRKGSVYLGRREALLLVSISWLAGAAFSALPFLIWAHLHYGEGEDHAFLHFENCYFEAMSGLTTTGATVLGGDSPIIDMPRSLLLWRAMTHWLGGLGIVVLFVAVLPTLGVGGKKLFRVEAPGPSPEGLLPNIRETARMLILIYLGMTAASVLLLRFTGAMDWFESICHTMSMVSTGGLSTQDASIGAYDNVAVDIICLFFMMAAGVNFAVFYMMARGQWRRAWKDVELRVYLALKVVVIAFVALSLLRMDTIVTTAGKVVEVTGWTSLQYSSFQVIALHTGTGFCTADYDQWPFFARALLVGLMFIGGCAGSTAGGIKVTRFWIMLKVIVSSLERSYRPHVVRPTKVAGVIVSDEMKLAAMVYVVIFVLLFSAGAVTLRMLELDTPQCDWQTAMSASVSTISNVGPGLHGVGPIQHYGWFSMPSKILMSMLMLLGRLEVFAIIVLLTPRFWKGD